MPAADAPRPDSTGPAQRLVGAGRVACAPGYAGWVARLPRAEHKGAGRQHCARPTRKTSDEKPREAKRGDEGKPCNDAFPRHRTLQQVRCRTRQHGSGRRLTASRPSAPCRTVKERSFCALYAGWAPDAARSGAISWEYWSKLSCTAFFARSGPKKSCTRTLLFSSFL